MKKDLLSIDQLSREDMRLILDRTRDLKERQRRGIPHESLRGKVVGMIFEKPSLRTRVTFEVAMVHLGGSSIFLAPQDIS
ncbi:MAG: hypothetical protein KC466_08625 [Myxococcales bacterium]|nr:hypothetical protein [Myxococcales bacterium]